MYEPAAEPRKRVTSLDVARAARVSQATVSRAFASPKRVSEDARRRVFAAAADLGYTPNAIARTLSSRTSRLVGVVVPSDSEYYEHALTLFARHLAPRDYQLLLFEYEVGTDIERVLRAVRSYQVDALVVSAMIISPTEAANLQASGLPVVMFNYQNGDGTIPFVSVDSEQGFRDLAEHLVSTGHRSVVYAGGRRSSDADRSRYRGASETLAAHGVPCRYVEAGDFSYPAGLEVVDRLMDGASPPDAVMAASDSIAFGVIDGLRTAGVAVPDDVSVTGFDGLAQAAWRAYDLTTIEQPLDDLVESAISVVMDAVSGDARDRAGRVVPGALRIRSTVADRRGRE